MLYINLTSKMNFYFSKENDIFLKYENRGYEDGANSYHRAADSLA